MSTVSRGTVQLNDWSGETAPRSRVNELHDKFFLLTNWWGKIWPSIQDLLSYALISVHHLYRKWLAWLLGLSYSLCVSSEILWVQIPRTWHVSIYHTLKTASRQALGIWSRSDQLTQTTSRKEDVGNGGEMTACYLWQRLPERADLGWLVRLFLVRQNLFDLFFLYGHRVEGRLQQRVDCTETGQKEIGVGFTVTRVLHMSTVIFN